MISTLRGTVTYCALNTAIIELGGFGIQVNLTVPFAASLRVGEVREISTCLVVREDSLTLYGFENQSGKEVFELLQRVSGIGPKVALSALSLYQPEEIINFIALGDHAALEKIPGLGKKGVARVVLELKEKVIPTTPSSSSSSGFATTLHREEIKSALLNLGYTNKDSETVLDEYWRLNPNSDLSLSQMLKSILQMLGTHSR